MSIGRRLPDVCFGELPCDRLDDIQAGDYWKYLDRQTGEPMLVTSYPSNLTGTVWGYCPPNGAGIGTLMQHTVREHEDGTITVAPGDGSSNSILHDGSKPTRRWHGYIEHGEWRAA